MAYDEFFTDSDKPYAENLNDALLLLDAFDVTVPVSMPEMYNNGEFNSTVDVTRKCGVALVTLKSVDSGVTIGTDEISGTGDVVFRVYPNFNSFYKWSKIVLEKSGTVSVAFKKIDGTSISATVGADGTISEAADLKTLQEIDVVLSLSNASISNILIWFINNQGERTRAGALLAAEQLVNVHTSIVEDDPVVVSGGAVYDSVELLSSQITELTEDKENKNNKVNVLDSNSNHYPSCPAVNTALSDKVDKITGKSLSTNDYTTTEKNKLAGIANNANNYTHPSSKQCNAVIPDVSGKENISNKLSTLRDLMNNTTYYPSMGSLWYLFGLILNLVKSDITVEAVRNQDGSVTITSNTVGLLVQANVQSGAGVTIINTYTDSKVDTITSPVPNSTITRVYISVPILNETIYTKEF